MGASSPLFLFFDLPMMVRKDCLLKKKKRLNLASPNLSHNKDIYHGIVTQLFRLSDAYKISKNSYYSNCYGIVTSKQIRDIKENLGVTGRSKYTAK